MIEAEQDADTYSISPSCSGHASIIRLFTTGIERACCLSPQIHYVKVDNVSLRIEIVGCFTILKRLDLSPFMP